MKIELWEIQNYVKQAMDDYANMTNDAADSGKVTLAFYYDGISQGMKLLLDYLEQYDS